MSATHTVIGVPPLARREPVVDTYHGTEVVDPYRWLEDPNSPETREWLDQQQHYSRSYLDSLPHRAEIRERLAALSAFETITEPHLVNGRCFFLRLGPDDEQARLWVREGISGKARSCWIPWTWATGPSSH